MSATLALEGALFVVGLVLYFRSTTPKDRAGRWGLWGLVAFLLVAYAGAAFGPPPPSIDAVAWSGLAGGLVFGLWGFWIDRHRESVG